jgi:hypothetical protein
MHINDIHKAEIPCGTGWQVSFHELYYLFPDMADQVEGCPEGFGVWHSHFGQDLLQMKNPTKGLLLDVGWYPHADPSGSFGLVLIVYDPSSHSEVNEQYHWESPLLKYQTRSLDSLLKTIKDIVQ